MKTQQELNAVIADRVARAERGERGLFTGTLTTFRLAPFVGLTRRWKTYNVVDTPDWLRRLCRGCSPSPTKHYVAGLRRPGRAMTWVEYYVEGSRAYGRTVTIRTRSPRELERLGQRYGLPS